MSKKGPDRFSVRLTVSFLLFALLSFPASLWAQQAPRICVEGKKELQGSYDVIQGRGGIWGLLETFKSLRDKSVLGLQLDGKLQRTVVIFGTMCQEGKKPTPELFDEILALIGETRAIFNLASGNTPTKKILQTVKDLVQKTDALIGRMQ